MKFELFTATICFLGWVVHWLLSWGEAWKKDRKSLLNYLNDDPPAFFVSLFGTLAVYLIGPSIIPALGLSLPIAFDDPNVKGALALFVGYSADSIIYKLSNILPKREQ